MYPNLNQPSSEEENMDWLFDLAALEEERQFQEDMAYMDWVFEQEAIERERQFQEDMAYMDWVFENETNPE